MLTDVGDVVWITTAVVAGQRGIDGLRVGEVGIASTRFEVVRREIDIDRGVRQRGRIDTLEPIAWVTRRRGLDLVQPDLARAANGVRIEIALLFALRDQQSSGMPVRFEAA
jgi:hypothetical protein